MEVYEERNRVVFAYARAMRQLGHDVGVVLDDPEWPVIYVDTPAGQVSWHVPRDELPEDLAALDFRGKWDGHTTQEKYRRLEGALI